MQGSPMSTKSERRQALWHAFTIRVSQLLTDPGRLSHVLTALGLDVQHSPGRGCFIGRCPLCGTAGTLYVRYTDTESSTYPVFWTCRNPRCKSKCRHSSV